eukprot:Opistho-2@31913
MAPRLWWQRYWRTLFCVVVVLCLGIAAAVIAYNFERGSQLRDSEEHDASVFADICTAFGIQLATATRQVFAMAAVAYAQPNVTLQQFGVIAKQIIANDAYSVVSLCRFVPSDQRAAFELSIRATDGPADPTGVYTNYTINERSPANLVVNLGDRPYYTPVLYVYGHPATTIAGNDVMAVPMRNASILAACDGDKITVTGRIMAPHGSTMKAGLSMFVPSYSGVVRPTSIADRRARFHAVVMASILAETLMNRVTKSVMDSPSIGLYLFDVSDGVVPSESLLYCSADADTCTQILVPTDVHPFQGIKFSSQLSVADRQWVLVGIPLTLTARQNRSALASVVVAAMLSALGLCAVVLFTGVKLTQYLAARDKAIKEMSAAETERRIANMMMGYLCHEARNAINGIAGLVSSADEWLRDDPVTASVPANSKARADITMCGDLCMFLRRVLNDTLDIRKLEEGQLMVARNPQCAGKFAVDLRAALHSKMAEKPGVLFEIVFDPPALEAAVIECDEFRVMQVLLNLLGNAMKFTDSGSVVLSISTEAIAPRQSSQPSVQKRPVVRRTGTDTLASLRLRFVSRHADAADQSNKDSLSDTSSQVPMEELDPKMTMLVFTVTDTGRGIPADKLETVFRPFVQVDAERDGTVLGGTGLGLYLCQLLTRAMGGSITVASDPGQGSQFRVDLPMVVHCGGTGCLALPSDGVETVHIDIGELDVSAGDAADAVDRDVREAGPSHTHGSVRHLVCDDGAINRLVLRRFLERHGHVVDEADSGVAALALVAERAYDAVWMDVHMPGMDGLTATRAMRASGLTLPIIGVSGSTGVSAQDKCEAAGMTCSTPKPLARVTVDRIARAVEGARGSPGCDVIAAIRDAAAFSG